MTVSALGATSLLLPRTETRAQDEDAADYAFAVIADPHLREDRDGELTGVAKFRALLERLGEQRPAPEFALVLGDIHPEKLEPLLPEIELPLHVIHGNHEQTSHREMLRAMFPEDFAGRDYYSFERGDDLFVALCNATPTDHIGHFQSQFITPQTEQLAWLEALLARRTEWRHVVVYGHVPPEEQCGPNRMCLAQNDARWLRNLVARTQPTALLFGHRHRRIEFELAGVPVRVVRSVNWNFGEEQPGGLLVTVDGEAVAPRFVPTG